MNENAKNITISAGQIIGNCDVAPGHFLLSIKLPGSFPAPVPGQFVMLRNLENGETLLSRPFSVYGFRNEGGQTILELLCRVAGRGTQLLSRLGAGGRVEVMGPLGHGFTVDPAVKRIILLAGGVGAAPLSFFLQEHVLTKSPLPVTAFLGAKTSEIVTALQARFTGLSVLRLATDDGSAGYHGAVTDILGEELQAWDNESTQILACGPTAMTRALARLLGDNPIRCQVSLEERMACGVGACIGCVVATKDAHGEMIYKRVCKDGPVFDIRKLVWKHPF
ncbi:MAG: dihydroorotate dehydrogenase electron transfer subunit [Syntrophales bacterium]